jgi:hypothetical protein
MNQLSKSSEICVCPEADVLYDLLLKNPNAIISEQEANYLSIKLLKDVKFKQWKINLGPIEFLNKTKINLFYSILELFRNQHFKTAEILIFKHNYLLDLFDKLEDKKELKWICLFRNPNAIYASQKNTPSPFTKKAMCKNPLSLIDQWNNFYIKSHKLKHTTDCYIIIYEELLTTMNDTMQRLFSFLSVNEKWLDCNSQKGVSTEWLSEDYQIIHPFIDKNPKLEFINKWQDRIKNYELNILEKHKIKNEFYPLSTTLKISSYYPFYILYFRAERKFQYLKKRIKAILKHHA